MCTAVVAAVAAVAVAAVGGNGDGAQSHLSRPQHCRRLETVKVLIRAYKH